MREKKYKTGDVIRVHITSIDPQYGFSVKTVEGISGLIRKNDFGMSGYNFSEGDDINVFVISVRPDGKLNLSYKKIEDNLRSQIKEGDIIEAKVISVNDYEAQIEIINSGVKSVLPREELSLNVIRASDEVFKGEHIEVVYLGYKKGMMLFSRKYIMKDKYDSRLYDMSLMELLATMGLATTRFKGKCIEIKGNYFLTDLMSVDKENDDNDGKLLIDPVNGRSLYVIVNNKLRNLFIEGKYYEVDIDMANKEYRLRKGTPYNFCVVSNNIKEVENPYKESVDRFFKQHMSPNTNKSVAALLEEVGQNLYSSKKRMLFELLQNADDEASKSGVKVKIQIKGSYFVLTHDGYAFNKHDFRSITSAAQSTKSANKNKTGYKGIGFKSVFTNSETVLVKSCGFTFKFDKTDPFFNNFEKFYFYVNEIEHNPERQANFLEKFKEDRKTFDGVKDVPWQLLPIWSEDLKIDVEDSIFNERGNKKANVAIALKMDTDKLEEYNNAVKEVFHEPRFMLFLRNTRRIQLIQDNQDLTIQKNESEDGKSVSLVNTFDKHDRIENYNIYTIKNIEVSDDAFSIAGVRIKREERTNKRGEKENYFVRIDEKGNSIRDVPGIPDRIASSTITTISFAMKLDENKRIVTLKDNELSFYTYLPMNEHRFKFSFFINAEFIPKSDREGIQSDNPWNHFLFYIIGKSIVAMVADQASLDEPEYLNLLVSEDLQSSSQDTAALTDAFNKGYHEALDVVKFILNDKGEKVGIDDIVYDESGLAEAIGADGFYELMVTEKRLPHSSIKSEILRKEIFRIEKFTKKSICELLSYSIDSLKIWVAGAQEEQRNNFYKWIVENKETTESLIPIVPAFRFGDEWKSISEISLSNKMLILTEHISAIKDILGKLGFIISCQKLEDHPLKECFNEQEEKEVFGEIKDSDTDSLNFAERLQLFRGAEKLDGIGDGTLRKWNIFKNLRGEYQQLACMFAYTSKYPSWLSPYMIAKEEYNECLDKYLVSQDDIYSSIVVPYINNLLSETDITEVYNKFKESWQGSFTLQLFTNDNIPIDSLLSIVELSDSGVKEKYVTSGSSLPLDSSTDYGEDTYEYRLIRLATLNDKTSKHLRSIITIDGRSLLEYTIKDELTMNIDRRPYKFSLSNILGPDSLSSVLGRILEKFSGIPELEKIFAQKEASPSDVMNKLYEQLKKSSQPVTAEQFSFFMAYMYSYSYNHRCQIFNQYYTYFGIAKESVFQSILDRTMEMGCVGTLKEIINYRRLTFPFTKLIDTYFDSKEYTLPEERTPEFINAWAKTPDKKNFLRRLGLHDQESDEIRRRKSFKEEKYENIWNLSERIIITFLNWVTKSFDLPINNENQVKILKTFPNNIIQFKYYLDDFYKAKEWENSRYLEWKRKKGIRIYIIDGLIPYRGMYNDTYLYKGVGGEYIHFEDPKIIYISSNREPAAILTAAYSNNSLKTTFTKDDWNFIFMVSAEEVYEKDKEIEKLRRENEELRRKYGNDPEVKGHGEATDRDNLSEAERKDINREARKAAKEFLDSLDDYDCSDWDPEEEEYVVKDKIRYRGKTIVVAITSSRARKLYLHPQVFAELMEDPDNLLLNYRGNGEIYSLSFDDVFKGNPNVNLIFDMDIVTSKHMAELANKYRYTKKTCFVIENPQYSQSDEIRSFGLNEKKEGGEVNIKFTKDEIFGY